MDHPCGDHPACGMLCTQEVEFVEQVAIRQLRDSLSAYLRRVRDGQSLLITDRGLPVARLSPAQDSMSALEAEGVVEWSSGKPRGATRPAVVRGGAISDLVAENRR